MFMQTNLLKATKVYSYCIFVTKVLFFFLNITVGMQCHSCCMLLINLSVVTLHHISQVFKIKVITKLISFMTANLSIVCGKSCVGVKTFNREMTVKSDLVQ